METIILTSIIVLGVIICVGFICYANIQATKSKFLVKKLKDVLPTEFYIQRTIGLDEARSVLYTVYSILNK